MEPAQRTRQSGKVKQLEVMHSQHMTSPGKHMDRSSRHVETCACCTTPCTERIGWVGKVCTWSLLDRHIVCTTTLHSSTPWRQCQLCLAYIILVLLYQLKVNTVIDLMAKLVTSDRVARIQEITIILVLTHACYTVIPPWVSRIYRHRRTPNTIPRKHL